MEFFTYLPEVLAGWNIVIIVLATIVGLLLGATPGLSPTMAVALLIPFTFQMEATTGLIVLGVVYAATVAGGAVSAILVNIPGAPANIATMLDGHPMAKNGRATEALHYCFISSGIGGVIGVLILIFFTPVLVQFALQFGPSELFWTAILGVTVIGSLGSASVLKGLLAGAFGIWLSLIGQNPVLGADRFVYTTYLEGGITIIPALIGLFAIPQVLYLVETAIRGQGGEEFAMEDRPVLESLKYNVSRVRSLIIGSSVGSVIGLIPGAGGQIAGLIAYDQNKKLSRHPEHFGSGEADGVIGSESANNAMVGTSLVPMLSLGIPGSPTAAVLLGGLLIQGLFPGPSLFSDHAEVAWTFMGALLIGQFVLVGCGLYLARFSKYVLRIPKQFLAAAVTILAVFGTYSVQNSVADVVIMISLGVAMYVAMRHGFSPAPVVLGIILGPIAETNFLQGEMIATATGSMVEYFLLGPINMVLIGLCVVSVVYSVVAEFRIRRRRRENVATSGESA